ncbi:hypothetical protein ILUMI_26266 [Ignelater luminosus]|uniref:Mutator-like transposase domain-containing protein n=1 Tax=Ignelater luminosus TaxID=2038154 RepID=A0A8K0FXF9_IGNLU|nr:hypothetical protein ILUMI_26266 [Ignelater luminosus]
MKLITICKELLFDIMTDAGQKERYLAIENGDVTNDETPFITVIVDGGWSHRSHGHRYDANFGVSCVIVLRTKKLLHLDIRNKYCAMCEYLKKTSQNPTIVALKTGMAVHGDSSVHKRLNGMVPYGRNIEKIECANHVTKNYTKALLKILVTASIRNALIRLIIKRLTRGARSAFIYNAKHGQNSSSLREDLRNRPFHVSGVHENCKSYFCKTKVNKGSLDNNRLQALHYVQKCLKPVLRKAHQLISNKTSNLAEKVMSLNDKFVGGKKSPPSTVKRFGQTRLNSLSSTRKCLFGTNKLKNRNKVDVRQQDHGRFCQTLDMDLEELEKEANDLMKFLQVTVDKRSEIEEKTRMSK